MTPEDKVKAIEFLVHDVFIAEHNRRLAHFLAAYGKQVRDSTMLSMQIGIPVQHEPLKFDLREPVDKLISNIIAVEVLFKKKPKKKL